MPLVLVFLLLIPGTAQGAPERFHHYLRQHWSLEQGLPQVAIADIAQDPDGFIWFGTQEGLARFDGLEFRTYTVSNSPGLAGNNITSLAFDTGGILWVGTRNGLSRFDGERFTEVRSEDRPLGGVSAIAVAGRDVLVASQRGAFRWSSGTAARVLDVPEAPISLVVRTESGGLMVGLPGLLRDGTGVGAREYNLQSFGEGVVPKQFVRGCGGDWLATTVGLLRFTGTALEMVEPVGRINVNEITCDADGTLWVGSDTGVVRLDNGRLFERVDSDQKLPHRFVTALLRDRDGAMWLGTLTGGLYRLAEGRYTRYSVLDGLPFAITFAVAKARGGGLWVGGQGGVARLRNGQFEPFRFGAPGAAAPVVTSLLEDRAGRLWVGMRNGATWVDLATGRESRVVDDVVLGFGEGPDGTIWIGALGGLLAWRDGRVESRGREQGLGRARSITVSPRLGVMVSTERGVFAQVADGQPFTHVDAGVFPEPQRAGSIFEDEQGDLWIGYLEAGLAHRSASTGRWRVYTMSDGLLADGVSGVRVGRDGRHWVTTVRGVQRLDRATGALDTVVSISGQQPGASAGYCCNGGTGSTVVLDEAGTVWVPSLDGVLAMDTAQPPVRPRAVRPRLLSTAPAELPAGARDAEFAFTAPVFDQPQLVNFQYRLEGYDTAWRDSRGRRTATYTNLPPGTFRFRVRTGGGEAGEATWAFSARPRFIETWWFLGAVALLLAGAGWGTHEWRLRRVERERARLEAMVHERTAQLEEANTQLAAANEQLEALSRTDPLTKLWNRRYLTDRVERDIAQVLRLREQEATSDLVIALLLIDVDHFKRINDTHGHDIGDLVLVETARRLRRAARAGDYIVRWGGEEFLFVACFTRAQDASRIAERVMEVAWREPFDLPLREPLQLTGSIGFSVFPSNRGASDGAESWEQSVAQADVALYRAKQGGRNRWVGPEPAAVD